MHPGDYMRFIVGPACAYLAAAAATPRLDSEAGRLLTWGTPIYESNLDRLDQWTGPGDVTLGPAYGVGQVEPPTYLSLRRDFVDYRPALRVALDRTLAEVPDPVTQLVTNLFFGACVTRLLYWRVAEALPPAGDLDALGGYYKRHYNTPLGKGSAEGWAARVRAELPRLRP